MGNIQQCIQYQNDYLSTSNNPRLNRVSTAPAITYAIKLKDQFPELLPHIQQQRKRLSNNSIINIIKQASIFYIRQKQAIYQGFWQNGLPSGECRIVYHDKSYYQGKILNGELDSGDNPNQQGLYIFSDGSYYIGNFKNSCFQGKGQLNVKIMRILGEFKNGIPHGKCKQKFYSIFNNNQILQQTYQGHFFNGHKQGKGKYYVGQKLIYQGQFYQGSVHGQGLLLHQNGEKFQGKFLKGIKQEGQLMLINGNIKQKYNQNYKIMKGYGIFQWNDGKFYIGEFKNQYLHGNGAIYFPNGNVIQGKWFQGHNLKITQKYQITQKQRNNIREKCLQNQNQELIMSKQQNKLIHNEQNLQFN